MHKTHIIWGNYSETEALIEELQQYEMEIITVIDGEMKSGLKRQGDIVFASKDYVEYARLSQVTEFHYYYIAPHRRRNGVVWKVEEVIGLLHEFLTEKR